MNLTKTGFRKHLLGMKDWEVAGRARTETRCPIAMYIYRKTGQTGHVGSVKFRIGPYGNESTRLPKWAMKFNRLLDGRGKQPHEVHVSRALHVLSQV